MRSIAMIGSVAALFISLPLAAQNNKFRTDDINRGGRIQLPSSVQEQRDRDSRRAGNKIPPGHLPPAGMCRIWIDGVPPGRQPAPTDCQTAVATKPANARVIWGDQTPFPGKGKDKAKSDDRFDDDDDKKGKKNKMKDRRDHDRDDDDDDKVRADRRRGTIMGRVIPQSSQTGQSKKGRGGDRH